MGREHGSRRDCRFTPGCLHSLVERSRGKFYGTVLCGKFLRPLLPRACGLAWRLLNPSHGEQADARTGLFQARASGPAGPISARKQSPATTIQVAFFKPSTGGHHCIGFRADDWAATFLRRAASRRSASSAAGTPDRWGRNDPAWGWVPGLQAGPAWDSPPAATTFFLRRV